MTVIIVPGTLPALVDWAEQDPQTLLDALDALDKRKTYGVEGSVLSEVEITATSRSAPWQIAFASGQGKSVVLQAGRHVSLNAVRIMARRLSRINWAAHLLHLDLTGVPAAELFETLVDVTKAIDLTEPVTSRRAPEVMTSSFVGRLVDDARPWGSSIARNNLKALLDAASDHPQLVDRRDGERIVLMSEKVLEAYADPMNAAELVTAFGTPPADMRMTAVKRGPARPRLKIDRAPAVIAE
tara:strand:+ start:5423 stop:6145 length:723 start_codon:yes stop_codon:yes gene_type:complete